MTELRSSGNRRTGAASEFIDSRIASGRMAFPLTELAKATGLSADAAKGQLRRLGRRVTRASPGQPFFLIVTPEHGARGCPPTEWWIDDYFRWLGRPYYLALQTAAAAHGSSPQAVQSTQVMTDSPRRPLEVGRVRVEFFVKRAAAGTPVQQLSNAFAPARVSTPAATAYDLIRYADRIGGIGRAIETLRPLVARILVPDLRSVLEAEGEVSTAQRLGYVLARAGEPALADAVDQWLPGRRPAIPLAAPAPRGESPPVPPWRVIDNTGEFQP